MDENKLLEKGLGTLENRSEKPCLKRIFDQNLSMGNPRSIWLHELG